MVYLKKAFIFIIICAAFVINVFAYTPDSYDAIEITLEGSYIPDSYDSIEIILDKSTDTCTCPAIPANWEINMSDSCNLTTACHIPGYNVSFVGEGYFNCNSTLNCSHFTGGPDNSNIRQSVGCKIQVAG